MFIKLLHLQRTARIATKKFRGGVKEASYLTSRVFIVITETLQSENAQCEMNLWSSGTSTQPPPITVIILLAANK